MTLIAFILAFITLYVSVERYAKLRDQMTDLELRFWQYQKFDCANSEIDRWCVSAVVSLSVMFIVAVKTTIAVIFA